MWLFLLSPRDVDVQAKFDLACQQLASEVNYNIQPVTNSLYWSQLCCGEDRASAVSGLRLPLGRSFVGNHEDPQMTCARVIEHAQEAWQLFNALEKIGVPDEL